MLRISPDCGKNVCCKSFKSDTLLKIQSDSDSIYV